ncbi:9426_t:CDS:2 [Ambispora leptoticha]|uniref:9426_t:CDS:1 n=1 Tax=Ambispora leptoticha TaxID=144679 RepID=A0A9N9F1R6_9GLOM|nr:9426_t:CDS:2 [Ambispora leptoticha]
METTKENLPEAAADVSSTLISQEDTPFPPQKLDLEFPNQTEYLSHIGVDIGGSLAKLVFFSVNSNSSSSKVEKEEKEEKGEKEEKEEKREKEEKEKKGGNLNFVKFSTDNIDECIEFIRKLVAERRSRNCNNDKSHDDNQNEKSYKILVNATGGGAHKYHEKFINNLEGIKFEKKDEMDCLTSGLNFLITRIPNEVFTYNGGQSPMICYELKPDIIYPYMEACEYWNRRKVVIIIIVVIRYKKLQSEIIRKGIIYFLNSILKVTGPNQFERISGSSVGGGTYWGLASLLTGAKSFEEMLELSKSGDNTKVDLTVGDIYGGDYTKRSLKSSVIASSMAKPFRKNEHQELNLSNIRKEDISQSLLLMISNNIGQIAYLNAQVHGLNRLYFGGGYIQRSLITMNTLSNAIKFWSQGTMKAFFLRHDGYLGAVGAFVDGSDNLEGLY